MKIVKGSRIAYIPASHEDQQDPEVWKKVLLTQKDIISGKIQMINWAKLPVGRTFKRHYHEDMEEIFIILVGNAKMTVDTEGVDLNKGDVIVVPPKSIHMMENTGNNDVQYVVLGITIGAKGKTVIVE